ncbi:hypothetical protein EPUL_000002, partial [Erysiphe pulchra]
MGAQQSSSHDANESNFDDLKKKCYYEILGVDYLASDSELEPIKKAYRKKALELHPDRNFGDAENATIKFAEVQSAYEVLADSQERAWYDSYRDSLLKKRSPKTEERQQKFSRFTSADDVIALTNRFHRSMPFTNESSGFYSIFGKAFSDIALEEELFCLNEGLQPEDYPTFGSSNDDFETYVKPFYRSWVNFSTQKTFMCKNIHRASETSDRATRRILEKENKRLREEGIKEFNNAVRAFVIFIRKRDPRYIQLPQTEESRQEVLRRAAAAQAARSRAENQSKMANHIIPEWAKVQDQSYNEAILESEESEVENIECVVCRKIFKSENQFHAHEKSKKHIKAVKQLKRELQKENKLLNLEISSNLEAEEQPLNSNSQIQEKSDSELGTEIDTKIEFLEDVYDSSSKYDDDHLHQEMASHSLEEQEPLPKDKIFDAKKNLGNKNGGQNQRIGKAKLKRAKKMAKEIESNGDSVNLECKNCGNKFVSKNKLFRHIKTSNHAQSQHISTLIT